MRDDRISRTPSQGDFTILHTCLDGSILSVTRSLVHPIRSQAPGAGFGPGLRVFVDGLSVSVCERDGRPIRERVVGAKNAHAPVDSAFDKGLVRERSLCGIVRNLPRIRGDCERVAAQAIARARAKVNRCGQVVGRECIDGHQAFAREQLDVARGIAGVIRTTITSAAVRVADGGVGVGGVGHFGRAADAQGKGRDDREECVKEQLHGSLLERSRPLLGIGNHWGFGRSTLDQPRFQYSKRRLEDLLLSQKFPKMSRDRGVSVDFSFVFMLKNPLVLCERERGKEVS